MRAVVQRVKNASVSVDGDIVAKIDAGIVVLLGIAQDDTVKDMEYIADKCVNLRIFEDGQDVMNLSLKDIGAELLLVSHFMGTREREGAQAISKPRRLRMRGIFLNSAFIYSANGATGCRPGRFRLIWTLRL